MSQKPAVSALVLAACLISGCTNRGRPRAAHHDRYGHAAAPASRVVEGPRTDARVVIVALDGVRWTEVFEGSDPALSALALSAAEIAPNLNRLGSERGAFIGAPGRGTIRASGPNYMSLPGYTELLVGRPSIACQDNECPRTALPTILDDARAAGATVAAFASWERLDRAVSATPGAFIVSCGRHGNPAIDPFPGADDYRPDRLTAEAALAYYETELPDVFFLGLGDSDEHAHRGDYAAYVASIRHADGVLGRLLAILDRSGERGERTHVVVTADHGRARNFRSHGTMPEAARVWLVAAGPRFVARGRISSPHERRLADIAPTLRLVLGLPPDTSVRAGTTITELFGI